MKGKKILIFVEDEYEDLELQYPKIRMIEAGAQVKIAGPEAKKQYKGKHGYPCISDISINDVRVEDFDAVIIPGGYAPDKMRKNPKFIEITQQFNKQNKLVAYICHAGWIPASAKILKGVNCTSYFAIKDDLINAGAKWVDEPVVIDKGIISSRFPDDLPKFCMAIIDHLSNQKSVKKK